MARSIGRRDRPAPSCGRCSRFLALRYGADQIIVGVVIVAFCTGLTNYLTEQVLSNDQNLNTGGTFFPFGLPLLDKIPMGPALFNQNWFFYGAVVLLVAIHIGLFKTRWGLRSRAVSEHPRAAETVGHPRAVSALPKRHHGGRDRRHRGCVVHDRQRR